jgi:hypothetical protein
LGILNDITASIRLLAGLRRFLRRPMSFEEARAVVARRLETREEAFFELVRTGVYESPSSPYGPLLRHARCEFGDLVEGVRRNGIEAELRRLADAGVHVSFEEYRGRQPLVRDGIELRLSPSDFDNPRRRGGLTVTTGGSSGRPARTKFDLDFLTARMTYDALFFEMLDLRGVPLALWYPQLPAVTGISNSLRYAKLGEPVRRWFDLLDGPDVRSPWDCRAMTGLIVKASRLAGRPIAPPEPMGLDRVDGVLDWLLRQRDEHGRGALQTYVSHALRLARAANVRGVGLDGVRFVVGSEPMTSARAAEIKRSGAGVYARYMATEVGAIGLGCPDAPDADDQHVVTDTVALIQSEEANGGAFLLTSLLPTVPKLLLNVALGDGGRIVEEPCGCMLGAMGLRTHARSIASATRISCEGMAMPVSDLVSVLETTVRPKHGGGALDWQWVERAVPGGPGHLDLRVDPGVGALDAEAVVRDVLDALSAQGRGHRLMASAWREAGTIRVVREAPRATARGKMPALVRETESVPGVTE